MPFVEAPDTPSLRLPSYVLPYNPLRPSFGETVAAAFLKDNPMVNSVSSSRRRFHRIRMDMIRSMRLATQNMRIATSIAS